MTVKAGALFAGYGGLEIAISYLFRDVELEWYSEIEPGACRILETHWSDVVNIGDVTKVDWTAVTPVEVLGGGFPCQDLSSAGQRKGLRAGTRSGLWYQFREAIRHLKPRIVVIENVRGLLSADAHSDLGCSGCVEEVQEEPLLRALGAVLGDLADIGYDASWHGLRAADVGSCHGRWREFVVAYPAGSPPQPSDLRHEWDWDQGRGRTGSANGSDLVAAGGPLLGTPTARDGKGSGAPGSTSQQWGLEHSNVEAQILELFPTPTAVDMGGDKTPDEWDEWTDEMRERHNNGKGHGDSLNVEVQRLLPTPTTADGEGGHTSRGGDRKDEPMLGRVDKLLPTPQAHDKVQGKTSEQVDEMRSRGHGVANLNEVAENELVCLPTPTTGTGHNNSDGDVTLPGIGRLELDVDRWGKYAPGVLRWGRTIGRPAPAPTEINSKGNPRLSPRFSEWMMGLPEGWVTDVGIARGAQLHALGNGVVPLQAVAGIRAAILIAHMSTDTAWHNPKQESRWRTKLRREMRKK